MDASSHAVKSPEGLQVPEESSYPVNDTRMCEAALSQGMQSQVHSQSRGKEDEVEVVEQRLGSQQVLRQLHG